MSSRRRARHDARLAPVDRVQGELPVGPRREGLPSVGRDHRVEVRRDALGADRGEGARREVVGEQPPPRARRVARDHHALASRQERGALGDDRGPSHAARLARPRREQHQLGARRRPRWAASTHRPSGDSARPRPSPRRTGGAPSVRRRKRPYSSRLFCSSKRTKRPSSDSAVGKDQSSQERPRSRGSPGARPTISRCAVVRPTSTLPCAETSCSIDEPEHAEERARPAGEVGRE